MHQKIPWRFLSYLIVKQINWIMFQWDQFPVPRVTLLHKEINNNDYELTQAHRPTLGEQGEGEQGGDEHKEDEQGGDEQRSDEKG